MPIQPQPLRPSCQASRNWFLILAICSSLLPARADAASLKGKVYPDEHKVLDEGKISGKYIFRHGSSFSQQHWHPHPSFSPDDAYVLFTSCRAGNGDVYLIKLP